MSRPGNWNRNPWNRGQPRAPVDPAQLGPVMGAIVRERIRQQCSQEWLAQRTGWEQSSISSYERNLKRVPLAYVEAAAKALGMKIRLQVGWDKS